MKSILKTFIDYSLFEKKSKKEPSNFLFLYSSKFILFFTTNGFSTTNKELEK